MTAEIINLDQRRIERALARLTEHQRTFGIIDTNHYWQWENNIPDVNVTIERLDKDDDR